MGRLDVRLCEAVNLPDIQTFGKISPYAILYLEHHKEDAVKSTIKDHTLNPTWSDLFKIDVPTSKVQGCETCNSNLIVEFWNNNVVVDKQIGAVTIPLSGLKEAEVDEQWHEINCGSETRNLPSDQRPKVKLRCAAQDFGINDAKTAQYLQDSFNASASSSSNFPAAAPPPARPRASTMYASVAPAPHSGYPHHAPSGVYPPAQESHSPTLPTSQTAYPTSQYPPARPAGYPPPQGAVYPPAAPPANLGYPSYSTPQQGGAVVGGVNYYAPPPQQPQPPVNTGAGYPPPPPQQYPPTSYASGIPPQMY